MSQIGQKKDDNLSGRIISLDNMYENYFLDYASYVILERAVPSIEDGLKPVQRRILYSMKEKDDGRYHKVANLIGHTMQYHPHGDAAIGDALVNLGQKDLLIDTQGNWGDVRTGDGAAAPRYIEARLTKFALHVAFNSQTTIWQLSYDGRNQEPINLPMKFPLLLAQGVDGIAVGLSTKILPHNFIELCKASIKILEGKKVKLYPDFDNGGLIDVEDYQGGRRGGKVKIRAKIEITDKSTVTIRELPYGVNTSALIESVVKASEKGQIKIKQIIDNTAKDVELVIELSPGTSPDLTVDALYAFTLCEASVSPNACVIIDNKPHFLTVEEILRISTEHTKNLLQQELEIKKGELEEKWHMASLEKIFIENRIYRDIEEAESFDQAVEIIASALLTYVTTPSEKAPRSDKRLRLLRDITEEDIVKLTEIRIRRISKYNKFKHEESMLKLLEELDTVKYNLDHLTEFAINYFEDIITRFGKGKERRTQITNFETIEAVQVVANNAKLYVNRADGFIGTGLKKDEFICECSDIDDIITFTKDGKFQVNRIGDKVFVGKNIIHVAVWKKSDERTTYNLIYIDGKTGNAMAKRFNVTAITRDKSYDLTKGEKNSRVLYFTANSNGESEKVQIALSPGCKAKNKIFEFDFAEIAIKGRSAGGNIVTKHPARKVTQISVGKSSLGAIKIWLDEISGRINDEQRGKYLGEFDTGNQILVIYADGTYIVKEAEIGGKIELDKYIEASKLQWDTVISALHFEPDKGWTLVKRFLIETSTVNEKFKFISDSNGAKLFFATTVEEPQVAISYKVGGKKEEKEVHLNKLIEVKGWKAQGNKLVEAKILSTKLLNPSAAIPKKEDVSNDKASETKKYKPGDTLELEF